MFWPRITVALAVGLVLAVTTCQPLTAPPPGATPSSGASSPNQPANEQGSDRSGTEQRPLKLRTLTPGASCPVSPNSTAGGFKVMGNGPIYLIRQGPIHFRETSRVTDGWYFEKSPWLSSPTYDGPALIRGRQLDGPNVLRFQRSGPETTGDLPELRFPIQTGISSPDLQPGWRFQPAALGIRAPGCYGIQIDGLNFTETIVFVAVD
ncbi:MAG TPA: hypothetical protein VKX96_12520 [Chloroflexota bacterium]|nr:hypothetical protein [Chloroflexota bacterium]